MLGAETVNHAIEWKKHSFHSQSLVLSRNLDTDLQLFGQFRKKSVIFTKMKSGVLWPTTL